MVVFPYAKINIGLNIVARRPDGFHNIESVFYPIPLCDILEVVKSKGFDTIKFSSSGISIPGNSDSNLCVKAYNLLKKHFGSLPSVKCHLHKIIPIGAGMGGGSANGAFCLIALNQVLSLNLTTEELKNFAKQLGSDCTFFVDNIPSLVTGVGDKLQPISLDLSNYYLVLVYPEIHIGTKEAYAGINFGATGISLKQQISNVPPSQWTGKVKNDFETSIFKNHPLVSELKQKLNELGAEYASMTGSGSCVYGLFKSEKSIPSNYFSSLIVRQFSLKKD